MQFILKYFPQLSSEQRSAFETMQILYPEWNAKINVISRKDIGNLEINHILHSLAIAKLIKFSRGTRVLDFGTGGGFPAIPLAVIFPDVSFHLVDRVGKKLKVAESVVQNAGIRNVTFQHGDIAECYDKFDFVVSRAVMPLPDLVKLASKNIGQFTPNSFPPGIITLKGGDIEEEIKTLPYTFVENISDYFEEPFFETKKITYTPVAVASATKKRTRRKK